VIALSANALIGSRELFLEMGFQDFLPKPIDALELDTILKKWIPEHKIEALSDESIITNNASSQKAQPQIDFMIEGINTVQGITNAGGDEEGYIYMLDSFLHDTTEKINTLKHIINYLKTEENFANTSENTNVLLMAILQTIKNSAISIGAEEIAAGAAELEDKLKTGSVNALMSSLPAFSRHLQTITERIRMGLK